MIPIRKNPAAIRAYGKDLRKDRSRSAMKRAETFLPCLKIGHSDLKDIWRTLDAAGNGFCSVFDLARALSDPEMQVIKHFNLNLVI